jgi:hypothetical protein
MLVKLTRHHGRFRALDFADVPEEIPTEEAATLLRNGFAVEVEPSQGFKIRLLRTVASPEFAAHEGAEMVVPGSLSEAAARRLLNCNAAEVLP